MTPSNPIEEELNTNSDADIRPSPLPKDNPSSTELSGPHEPPRDESTSRPSLKSDKGKAKMPKIEDLDRNKSMHSLDSGYELGLDVPLMRTLGARKVFTAISEQF